MTRDHHQKPDNKPASNSRMTTPYFQAWQQKGNQFQMIPDLYYYLELKKNDKKKKNEN